jgi:predicted CxxxxCH...CXXCH cytochrome family protein
LKPSIRRYAPALSVVILAAAFVAACGQITTSEEAQSAAGVRVVQPTTAKLVQADFCADAESASCTPTGAHGALAVNFVTGHAGYECKECHYVGGRLAFKPASKGGLAFLPAPNPTPTFDATAKTCSNVACHSVPAGTFSYYFPDGDGNPVLNTVPYGGGTGSATPMWYATGLGCAACHANPPDYQGVKYLWHSGFHGNQGPTGAYNQCQLCHNDAVSTNGVATGFRPGNCNASTGQPVTGTPPGSVLCASYHSNGAVGVVANFRTACFGCH